VFRIEDTRVCFRDAVFAGVRPPVFRSILLERLTSSERAGVSV
jgi:hypothetical protein